MSYTDRLNRKFLLGSTAALAASFAMGAGAIAQDADIEEIQEVEEVVVTGSRIKRDAFSSTTPMQVLDASQSRKLGITSLTEMLQKSTAASGQQIDATINTNAGNSNASEAPPDGGIGSSNINLRGLGAERTLVLINGRRLGVAGVRGAPAQPDINMIPLAMVEGADILTGGASSIYGADAVAGVVNVRLKRDFEGIEVNGSTELTDEGGGNIFQTSITAGVTSDRGNITIGAEYYKRNRIRTGDRSFSECLRRIKVTESGDETSACVSGFFDNTAVIGNEFIAASDPVTGNIDLGNGVVASSSDRIFFYYTPGQTDIGVENWSTAYNLPNPGAPFAGFPGDTDGRAILRFPTNPYYGDQEGRADSDLVRPQERFSMVANGHIDLDWGNNEELYFEAYYFNRRNQVRGSREQIFPTVLGMIPEVDADGEVIGMVDNPLNPFSVNMAPIVTLDDLTQNFDVEVQQIRGLTGVTGDMPGIDGWSYDIALSYDRGTGFQSQTVLLEDRLLLATQTLRMNADGELECGIPNVQDDAGGFLTLTDCVPVDFFAPSIFGEPGGSDGTFANKRSRDYLLGTRTNRTVTQMVNFQAFATGDLFDINGGGTVSSAFGFEWRDDKINSSNSAVGVNGGNAAENPLTEGETRGSRYIYDFYGEVSVPFVQDADWAKLLQLDLAGRYTKDENFGDEFTYRIAGLYRPVDSLTISGSYNTSFRAPNLREQFLADQANGIGGGNDPCLANNVALLDPNNARDQIILGNCATAGVDTNVLGTAGVTTIQTSTGGSIDLTAETSESFTGSVQFSQPWSDSFDFDIAVTYFDISIENTVRELGAATIIARCYGDEANLASPFCSRVSRNTTSNPTSQIINFVRAGFINVGLETSKGLDFTTRFRTDFEVGGELMNLTWTTGTTRQIERNIKLFPDSDTIDNVGRIGSPKWLSQSTVGASWGAWEAIWQARYIGSTFGPAEIADISGFTTYGTDVYFGAAAGDVASKASAESRIYNDFSVTRNFETMTVTAGMNNIFNVKPPLIDGGAGPNRNNAVTSSGYDLFGRTFFVNASVRF